MVRGSRKKSFSIYKYGKDEAQRLACEATRDAAERYLRSDRHVKIIGMGEGKLKVSNGFTGRKML